MDACLKSILIEDFKPSQHSLEWIPYSVNQELLFSNTKNEKIKLICTVSNEKIQSLQSQFKIICPYDSSQFSYVNYNSFEYQNKLLVTEGRTSLISIDLIVDVIINESESTLDDVKLADILKINFIIKNALQFQTSIRILEFPVLDRGYTQALASSYLFFPSILLNNKTYSEVNTNYENNENLRVYYSMQGLLAFEIENELYLRTN